MDSDNRNFLDAAYGTSLLAHERSYLEEAFSRISSNLCYYKLIAPDTQREKRDRSLAREILLSDTKSLIQTKLLRDLEHAKQLDFWDPKLEFEEKVSVVSSVSAVLCAHLAFRLLNSEFHLERTWIEWISEFISSSKYLRNTENKIARRNPQYIKVSQLYNHCEFETG